MADEETQDLIQLREDHDLVDHIATLELEAVNGGSFETLEIPLYPGDDIVIGRDRNKCRHAIMDDRVSKQHFRIYSIIYEANSSDFPPLIYCEDLESSNGTYVNDVMIGKITQERIGYLLCDGDVIEIRPLWKFRFHQINHQLSTRSKGLWSDLEYFRERYKIEDRVLGKGQYGTVFLATEVETKKQLACKIIDLDLAIQNLTSQTEAISPHGRRGELRFTKAQKKRVLLEISILSRLSHPNIIDLKKAFCSHHSLFMFSELSSGGDLYSYMQAHGGIIDDYNSRFIIKQILIAVQYLHDNGIVHRDIKPENILVSQTYFGGRAILTDFGFAINICAGAGRLMSKLGTECYAAPEVHAVESSTQGYTQAADLWSLGVLTATMLTGDCTIPRQELVGLSEIEITERYFVADRGVSESELREIWLKLPPRALSFVRKLLTLDVEDRMTAAESLNHSWLNKPHREAEALAEGIEKVNRFWKQRESDENILEALPGVEIPPHGSITTRSPRFRRKLPDVSMASPYFGLDRHLYTREESTRKRILNDLLESGSQFVTSQPSPIKRPATSCSSPPARERVAPANNLFGRSVQGDREIDHTMDLEEVEPSPIEPPETVHEFRIQGSSSQGRSPTTQVDLYDIPETEEATLRKRSRRRLLTNTMTDNGIDSDDQPRYTSPQALRDSLRKFTLNGQGLLLY